MGESVVEGTILTWLKKEGDSINVDDPLVEVSTDKVDTEIPSPVSGTLVKILVPEGETVEIGTALCEVDEGGSAAASTETAEAPAKEESEAPADEADAPAADDAEPTKDSPAETPAEQTEAAPPAAEVEEKVEEAQEPAEPAEAPKSAPKKAPAAATAEPAAAPAEGSAVLSPLVRRLAREHNVDVSQVRGTGSGGRITKEDILAFVESPPAKAPAAPDGKKAAAAAPAARSAPPAMRDAAAERTEVQPVTHIRKRIAEHMRASLDTSARAWNVIEVDMEEIEKLRTAHKEDFRKREGFSLTYLPFIARAVTDALLEYPLVNASLNAELTEATLHHYVNLGIAVATDYGLIVPVVKGAEGMNVVGIARAVKDLADRAREKKLDPDDVGGSTFTITNPGPFGSYVSLPVINQPNVAILATEAVEKRVVVVPTDKGDMIGIRHRSFFSMSWDHRLLDGVDAMQFLQRLKENLETWDFSHEL
jgi:2-oxoglutarate dehydrogenase E2 component (dihydrolipoamide succinyltransferase)